MAKPRKKGLALQVDENTEQMTEAALTCRGWNHTWIIKPQSAQRESELLAQNLSETIRECGGGCGGVWTQIYDINTFDAIADDRSYTDKSYLMPKGKGRLAKREARKASFVRRHPQYAAA